MCLLVRWKVHSFLDFQFHDISLEAKLLRLKWPYVCVIDTKMNIEQRANIKFCFILGKTFKEGREDLNDDQNVGQPKSVITEDSIKTVRELFKEQPKSSVKFMEMELNISKSTIHRILTEHLGYRKTSWRPYRPVS